MRLGTLEAKVGTVVRPVQCGREAGHVLCQRFTHPRASPCDKPRPALHGSVTKLDSCHRHRVTGRGPDWTGRRLDLKRLRYSTLLFAPLGETSDDSDLTHETTREHHFATFRGGFRFQFRQCRFRVERTTQRSLPVVSRDTDRTQTEVVSGNLI